MSIEMVTRSSHFNPRSPRGERLLLFHKSSLYVAKVGKGKTFAKDKKFIKPEEAPKYARMIANRMFELF